MVLGGASGAEDVAWSSSEQSPHTPSPRPLMSSDACSPYTPRSSAGALTNAALIISFVFLIKNKLSVTSNFLNPKTKGRREVKGSGR